MDLIGTLYRRNLRVFLRDRTAVLTVVLAPIVLVVLFLVGLRDIPGLSNVSARGPQSGSALFDAFVFSTVAVVSGFSSNAGVLLGFLEARAAGRFELYLTTPVKKWQITASYVLAGITVSCAVSVVILGIGQLWALVLGQPTMPVWLFFQAGFGLVFTSAFFAGFTTFGVAFTRTRGAFAGFCLVGGLVTVMLSVTAILPHSSAVSMALSLLPFGLASIAVCTPALTPSLDLWTNNKIIRFALTTGVATAVLVAWTTVFMIQGVWQMNRTLVKRTPAAQA
jgi:multidrug/hemolysin transport system permease protein